MTHIPNRFTNRRLINPQTKLDWQDVERILALWADAIVENGIPRWRSNQQVPPLDILDVWKLHGDPTMVFDYAASEIAKEADDDRFIAAYRERMRNHVPSAEELFEMRAAFGAGATVVNVITGQRTKV
jgi:hypothetical protein